MILLEFHTYCKRCGAQVKVEESIGNSLHLSPCSVCDSKATDQWKKAHDYLKRENKRLRDSLN